MKSKRSKLIAKADKVFSQYIRKRNADHRDYVACFTCGKVDHWKSQDCGHFMSRKYYNTRWDEENCQVQCKGCNIFRHGEQFLFGVHTDQLYGHGKAEELHFKSREMVKLSQGDLQDIIDLYSARLVKLNN
mgnify:FL=1|tara:strand:+ start:1223 stop:1615 length:393 start_codon:yes stop_codon:yes gene_type:complete